MRFRRSVPVLGVVALLASPLLAVVDATPAQAAGDARVTSGSPAAPFSQNKQNEPALAVDPVHPNVVAAGANDNIDMEACNAGDDTTCPFTPGVGSSGIYFSTDSGASFTQPTYTGLTARGCLGAVGPDPGCTPTTGYIGTLPNYDTVGLASGGDPALAFGPVPHNGTFSWASGSRLYYANLATSLSGASAFKGDEAVAVSHTDDVAAAIAGNNGAWSTPVVASRQNSARFSDKEQIWADNVSASPYFGNVYVCYAAFQGKGKGFTGQTLRVLRSTDGGTTWTDTQVTAAATNPYSPNGFGRSGCTVRTDSHGTVYVFDTTFSVGTPGPIQIQMITSTNGGASWSRPTTLFTGRDTCVYVEQSIGRCVEDGIGGARDDLGPAPSVDIANGAPYGTDATDRMVISWVDGRDGLNHEHVMFSSSGRGGTSWTTPTAVERPGDRGYYSAPAISPEGTDVYLVYNAFTTPFRTNTTDSRSLVGVVLHADVTGSTVGAFTEIHRGAPGDPRGSSQNNLAAEFLGDYVYAVATRDYGAAVWNDVRDAADCPAIDAYRQALHDEAVNTGAPTAGAEEPGDEGDAPAQTAATPSRPAVEQACPATFGNSDIYGGSFADPTP